MFFHFRHFCSIEKKPINMSVSSVLGAPTNSQDDDEEDAKQILKLKIKKPKAWNWELSTSKSSSSINFPKILLYDHKNKLLAEANESDMIVNNKTASPILSRSSTKHSSATKSSQSFSGAHNLRTKHSASKSNNIHEMQNFLNEITSQLTNNGYDCKVSTSRHSSEKIKSPPLLRYDSGNVKNTTEDIDTKQITTLKRRKSISDLKPATVVQSSIRSAADEIPIYVYSEKGPLQRDLNAKEFQKTLTKSYARSATCNLEQIKDKCIPRIAPATEEKTVKNIQKSNKVDATAPIAKELNRNFALTKSKSALTVLPQSGHMDTTVTKKKYRRTNSTNSSLRFSSSILERLSEIKRRSSSSDSEQFASETTAVLSNIIPDGEKEDEYVPPKYILRTSQAGTLVVCKDSFRHKKARRRPRTISNSNVLHENEDEIERNAKDQCIPPPELHYDKAIANIDDLINKVISLHHRDCDESVSRDPSNTSRNNDGGGVRGSKHSASSVGSLIDNQNVIKNQLHKFNNLSKVNCIANDVQRRKKNKKKNPIEMKCETSEKCIKKNTKLRRRSASAGSDRFILSSSSSEDDGNLNIERNIDLITRKSRERQRKRRPAKHQVDFLTQTTNGE